MHHERGFLSCKLTHTHTPKQRNHWQWRWKWDGWSWIRQLKRLDTLAFFTIVLAFHSHKLFASHWFNFGCISKEFHFLYALTNAVGVYCSLISVEIDRKSLLGSAHTHTDIQHARTKDCVRAMEKRRPTFANGKRFWLEKLKQIQKNVFPPKGMKWAHSCGREENASIEMSIIIRPM